MSDEKLLPCPFCGDEPELHWINEAGEVLTVWVSCKCGCEHHERLTKEVAVKKWNSRSIPNDAQASPESPYPIVEVFRKAPFQAEQKHILGVAAGAPEPRLEQAVEILRRRAAGYEGRATAIFSGRIMADELRANAREIEALADKGARASVIEECAKILDIAAQDWHRIRDPGMANNARSYAKQIRALAVSSAERGTHEG